MESNTRIDWSNILTERMETLYSIVYIIIITSTVNMSDMSGDSRVNILIKSVALSDV